MGNWKLNRTKQCHKCPWKVETNPHEIPNGYTVEKHENLRQTIANESNNFGLRDSPVMACHAQAEAHCIGWLVNEIGVGNNIGVRIKMLSCKNWSEVKAFGNQHQQFDDTLPKY